MSDSGAMPGPTVVTEPRRPRAASESRKGVSAASSGVRSPNSGMGSSPSPSRHTYRSRFTRRTIAKGSSVLDDERELLGVERRTAHERAVDLRVGHEVADVPGLHAPAVLHADGVGDLLRIQVGERPADQPDDLSGVAGLSVPPGPDGPDRVVRDHQPPGLLGLDPREAAPDLLLHLGFGPAGLALLQRLPH